MALPLPTWHNQNFFEGSFYLVHYLWCCVNIFYTENAKTGSTFAKMNAYGGFNAESERPLNMHRVCVVFEAKIVPGIEAVVGQFRVGGSFFLCTEGASDDITLRIAAALMTTATSLLRDKSIILPVERVGYPVCAEDSCTVRRYSEVDLSSRSRCLNSILGASQAMHAKILLEELGELKSYPLDVIRYIKRFLP